MCGECRRTRRDAPAADLCLKKILFNTHDPPCLLEAMRQVTLIIVYAERMQGGQPGAEKIAMYKKMFITILSYFR
jgi:hypothetical protein